MSEHDQNAFVERCLNKGYSLELGIRKAEEMMKQDLRAKQNFQLDHMKQNIDTKKVSLPLYPPPELKFNSIEFSDSFSSTQTLSDNNPDMCLALQDSNSAVGIKRCLDQKTSIDYLSLTHESMKTPYYGILAPHASVIIINNNNYASNPGRPDANTLTLQEKCMSLQEEVKHLKASLKRKQDELDKRIQTKSSRKKLDGGSISTSKSHDNRGEMVEEEGDKFDNTLNMELDHVSEIILCPNCSKKYASRQTLRKHCITHCQKKMSIEDFNQTFPPYIRK
jgi:hypothetical protein